MSDRQDIVDNIMNILDNGNQYDPHTGDGLAFHLNQLLYLHDARNETRGVLLEDAELPRDILMQFLAFRIPRNLFIMIKDYLDIPLEE